MTDGAGDRRDTPLALKLLARIARHGPLPLAEYMRLCLLDPDHGYYRRQPAVGARGDFITAPEISQIFGELIGLWAVVVWRQMGRPSAVNLIELGPGRGTLMSDALRAARAAPDFTVAASVRLVDVSAPLLQEQRQRLAGTHPRITWHDRLDAIPDGPAIVVANEFVDALPIDQQVWLDGAWRQRLIGLGATGALEYQVARQGGSETHGAPAEKPPSGAVVETRADIEAIAGPLARWSRSAPLSALFIDYGHVAPQFGDTLQAVRNHRYEYPLTSPGEADLTSQVDFADLAARFQAIGLAADGPIPQAEFLGRLGIAERASRLMAGNPGRAGEIETGVQRLMAPAGMGTRFKAISIRSSRLPPAPAFE